MSKLKWNISKVFNGLCYAHRVHCQDIRHALCTDGDTNACLRTHGHNGVAELTIGGNELSKGFVADFKELNFMKVVYDEMFDHRFVLDVNDPIADKLAQGKFMYAGEQGDLNNASILVEVCGIEYLLPIVPFEVKGTDLIPFYRVGDLDTIATMHPEFARTDLSHLEALSLVNYIPSSENFVKHMFELAQSVLAPYHITVVSSSWKETEKSTAVYFGE